MRCLITFLVLVALQGVRVCAVETPVRLGIVVANEDAFFDLVYQNTGSSPVQIKDVKPACDCITVLSHPAVVPVGSSVRIPCVYRSNIPGNIRTVVEILGANPAQPPATFRVAGFVAEKSWLVSAGDVLKNPSGKALLVDVRRADEFSRVHALRSLNLPVFSLKARTDLRPRQLVLFDDGSAPELLLAEVLTLRAQGFTEVAVLNGGLAAWVRAGGAVEGEGKSPIQLSVISAAKFGRSNDVSPWLCLEIGTGPIAGKNPGSVVQVATVQELEKKLAEWHSPVSGGMAFRPVLIVAADSQIQLRIENRFGRNKEHQFYYLDGSSETLEAYEAEQVALARHTGQTFVAHPVKSRPVVSGRCGSCGR